MELKPTLLKRLQDSDPTRHAAVEALMLIGEAAVPALVEALADPDPLVRGVAAEALGEIGSAAAIPALLAALGDPDPDVCRATAWALAQFGQQALKAMQVVPGLFEALDSPDARVRETAIMALGPIKHPDVPNALLWALGDDDPAVREAAADALGRLGKETLETLIGALGHEQPGVRAAVALALAKIAKQYGRADQATPALIERLGDYDATVRRIAAEALGQIEDPDATAALVERLWDDDPAVRRMAAWALGQIEDPDGMEGLIHALGDPDEAVREAAAAALGKLDEPPKLYQGGAVAALLDVLAGPWGEAPRRAAAQSLAQIGVRHAETGIAILPGLCAALADPDTGLRRLAARALGEVGGKLDESVPKGEAVAALVAALRDPDAEVRQNAASALGALGDAGAVGGLVAVLRRRQEGP